MTRATRWPYWAVAGFLPALTACSGEPSGGELTEPIRVHDAQFHDGELPGKPALTAAQINAGKTPQKPDLTTVETSRRVIRWDESGHGFSGRASTDAAAVALRFADVGSGYWLLPVGAPDPVNNDELSFRVVADIGAPLTPGLHQLAFAAIDEQGRSGNQSELELCIASPIPDNLNACVPTARPPETVVSLAWQANVDLDLEVLTPEGKLVDPKHPTTALEDDQGKVDPTEAKTGVLVNDANPECQGSGDYRENLVWNEKPKAGRYSIYVNLYDACATASTEFSVAIFTPKSGKAGTFTQQRVFDQSGVVLQASANGGAARGLYVGEFSVK